MVAAGMAAVEVVYAAWVRPRLMRWGATDEEVAGPYPGADLIPGGQLPRQHAGFPPAHHGHHGRCRDGFRYVRTRSISTPRLKTVHCAPAAAKSAEHR
jgi:hypothetical protein